MHSSLSEIALQRKFTGVYHRISRPAVNIFPQTFEYFA